jgi:flagellar biosynthesis protein FlhG
MSRDAEHTQQKLVKELTEDNGNQISASPTPTPNDLAHLGSPFAHTPVPADLIDLWDETERFFDALGDPSGFIEPEGSPTYKVSNETDLNEITTKKPVRLFEQGQNTSSSKEKQPTQIEITASTLPSSPSLSTSVLVSVLPEIEPQKLQVKESQSLSTTEDSRPTLNQTRPKANQDSATEPEKASQRPSLAERFTQRHQDDTTTVVIAGGKGGSGRSLLAANLAITLSHLNACSVGVVDLDPIGPTLHTFLGLEPLLDGLGKHLRGEVNPTSERVPTTNVILTRSSRSLCTPYQESDRIKTLQEAQSLNPKWLIIDAGNLQDAFTLDLFINANYSMMLYTPDPCGLERGHAFLQAALYRQLIDRGDEASVIAKSLLSADHEGILTGPTSLARSLRHVHPAACDQLEACIARFRPMVIVNECRTQTDRVAAEEICSVMKRKWRIQPQALGTISHHHVAHQSLLERKPLTLAFPSSSIALDIEKLTRRLLKEEHLSLSANQSIFTKPEKAYL